MDRQVLQTPSGDRATSTSLSGDSARSHVSIPNDITHIEHRGGEEGLVKKLTGFMSSSQFILEELDMKYPGGHEQVPLVAGRAAGAAIYPQMLCEAICRGVARQTKYDRGSLVTTGKMTYTGLKSFFRHVCDLQGSSRNAVEQILSTSMREGAHRPTGDYPDHWLDYWHEEDGGDDQRGVRPQVGVTLMKKEMDGLSLKGGYEGAWDDVTNAELVPELVRAARQVEMGYFRKLCVYDYATRALQEQCL